MKHLIPAQHTGKSLDIKDSRTFDSESDSKFFYQEAKNRLLQINKWYEIANLPVASFEHLDSFGEHSMETPQEGDFIKIDIPGPGLNTTGGYDYVQIEQIDESSDASQDLITLTLRPSSLPNLEDDHETKHFFKNMASSSIQVKRDGKTVEANYFGRNEVINLELDSLLDKLRNLFVALGAKLGASSSQWKALISGILHKP